MFWPSTQTALAVTLAELLPEPTEVRFPVPVVEDTDMRNLSRWLRLADERRCENEPKSSDETMAVYHVVTSQALR